MNKWSLNYSLQCTDVFDAVSVFSYFFFLFCSGIFTLRFLLFILLVLRCEYQLPLLVSWSCSILSVSLFVCFIFVVQAYFYTYCTTTLWKHTLFHLFWPGCHWHWEVCSFLLAEGWTLISIYNPASKYCLLSQKGPVLLYWQQCCCLFHLLKYSNTLC